MRDLAILGLATLAGLGAASPGMAAGFDGTVPLLCASQRAIECTREDDCQSVPANRIGVPDFVRIDVEAGTITPLGDDPRLSPVLTVSKVDGKLILQGAEDGVEGIRDGAGWSVAIDQENGRMVASAAGDSVAFVVFGACTPL